MNGKVVAISIARNAGEPLESITYARAIEGAGLEGDRYARGEGSFNKGRQGVRQVTLINAMFFAGTSFSFAESRRNIATEGVELMDLIGKEFDIGDARFRGVKYCDPCLRPSALAKKKQRFRDAFFDRGGLVAEVIRTGSIRLGDAIVPPKKDY